MAGVAVPRVASLLPGLSGHQGASWVDARWQMIGEENASELAVDCSLFVSDGIAEKREHV